jgi:hypothetical protein
MKRKIQGVIKETVKQSLLDYTKGIGMYLAIVGLYLILIANIRVSQTVNPLYFQMFSPSNVQYGHQNKSATVEFLKRIRTHDEFPAYLSIATAMYGSEIPRDVEREVLARREKITRLEALLNKNPKSRDILYALYELYLSLRENEQIAQSYLDKARSIDPIVGK